MLGSLRLWGCCNCPVSSSGDCVGAAVHRDGRPGVAIPPPLCRCRGCRGRGALRSPGENRAPLPHLEIPGARLIPSQALAAHRPVPLTGAPRAIEHGQRKAASGTTPGETGVYRNAMVTELTGTYRGASNLREMFDYILANFGDRPAQGTRPIEVRRAWPTP